MIGKSLGNKYNILEIQEEEERGEKRGLVTQPQIRQNVNLLEMLLNKQKNVAKKYIRQSKLFLKNLFKRKFCHLPKPLIWSV